MSILGLISFHKSSDVNVANISRIKIEIDKEPASSTYMAPPVIKNYEFTNVSDKAYEENNAMVREEQRLQQVARKFGHGVRVEMALDGYSYLAYSHSMQINTEPAFEMSIRKFEAYAKAKGYQIIRSDFDRTVEVSNKQRAKKGKKVAAGGTSPHNYGVGGDLVLLDANGKCVSFASKNSTVQDIVRYAQRNCGLEWGGEWDPENESQHWELRDWELTYKTEDNKWTYSRYRQIKRSGNAPNPYYAGTTRIRTP